MGDEEEKKKKWYSDSIAGKSIREKKMEKKRNIRMCASDHKSPLLSLIVHPTRGKKNLYSLFRAAKKIKIGEETEREEKLLREREKIGKTLMMKKHLCIFLISYIA